MATREEKQFAKAVCRRIRRERETHPGWSQEAVANALGIKLGRYKHYEEESLPHLLVLVKLAQMFGTSLEALIGLPATAKASRPGIPFPEDRAPEANTEALTPFHRATRRLRPR